MGSKTITVLNLEVVRDDRLSPLEQRHLRVVRTIAGWFNTPQAISKVVYARVEIAEKHLTLDGLCSINTRSIYFTNSTLTRLEPAILTLAHEIAHLIKGDPDDSPEHEHMIDLVSEEVIKRVEAGEIDYLLGDVVW